MGYQYGENSGHCTEVSAKSAYQLQSYNPGTDRHKLATNQHSLFRSRDWLSTNQGPIFPDSVGSCYNLLPERRRTNIIATDSRGNILEITFFPGNPYICSKKEGERERERERERDERQREGEILRRSLLSMTFAQVTVETPIW
eukprot:sb/3474126/